MVDRPIRSGMAHARKNAAHGVAAAVLAAASLFLASCLETQAPGPATDEGNELATGLAVAAGKYTLQAVHSGKCVDVAALGTADGTNVQQWTCNGKTNQQWTLRDVGGGYSELKAVHSGKCADVAAWSTANGGNVHQWSCTGGNNQKWLMQDMGGGQYQIKSAHSGKCMDVAGAGTADGANIQQYACANAGNQKFKVVPVTSDPIGGGGGGFSCTYADWESGKAYLTGAIVRFPADGKYYIAEHDNPGYDPTISTWFWDPYTCVSGPIDGGGGGDLGGSGLTALMSEATFNSMFPGRNPFYTYSGLVNATGSYPTFANEGELITKKRELAAFLANVQHETGGLVYTEEINKSDYCGGGCGCAAGKRYYGRGPLQLSWNYNYCAAGSALGLPLQSDPDLVARDAKVAWQTGLWFWMTQSGAGYRSGHASMVGGNGFGETIRTINGSLECNGGNPGAVQSRIDAYRRFCQLLGVDPGANLGC
ncbi:MAG: uncharacterized protein JWP91_2830 [Fibrobacteres bacterium]|nr:uncharacterized protein [Fibrobacterota bacterium]